MNRKLTYFCLLVLLAACSKNEGIDSSNKTWVQRGHELYQSHCSACHGQNGEGQPNWRVRKADERLPAPPMDGSGHTWHHDDKLLFSIVKYGMKPPYAPEGYKSDMSAWGEVLSDQDIWSVLSYIKSRWPEKQQRHQESRNK